MNYGTTESEKYLGVIISTLLYGFDTSKLASPVIIKFAFADSVAVYL